MARDRPIEHCGLCGVSGGDNALTRIHLGLHTLQHRGQEAAGVMAVSDGQCRLHKDVGLVDTVFGALPPDWKDAAVSRAVSHVRYSTAGGGGIENAQPLMVNMSGQYVGVAHNGTICNARSLRAMLQREGAILQTSTDTELVLHLMARSLMKRYGGNVWDALADALGQLRGAFSLLVLTADGMAAARDPYGFRPLSIGDYDDGGYMVASETIAFGVTGASYVRDVEPGEVVIWGPANGLQSRQFAESPRRAHCIFEHVYFARPGGSVFGDSVYEVRKEMGRRLAQESPCDADVIVPVPDGGVYAALGYAEESGIPFDMGISRNHYVGRTFIDPGHISRRELATRKLQPIREAMAGKKVCLIDDSIVRGSTSRARVHTLREFGVSEVHMRISCPPHRFGCYFGIDFPQKETLIANKVAPEDICRALRLNSLRYLSQEGMLSAVTAHRPEDYCCACFDGNYPVTPDVFDQPPLPEDQ